MQGLVQGMLGAKKDVDSILVSRLADGWMDGWIPRFSYIDRSQKDSGWSHDDAIERSSSGYVFCLYCFLYHIMLGLF
jgi:hypothetical protein